MGASPSTGWHTHPGPSLVIVTQGTVTEIRRRRPDLHPAHLHRGHAEQLVRRHRRRGRPPDPGRKRRRGPDDRGAAHPRRPEQTAGRRQPGKLPLLTGRENERGRAPRRPRLCRRRRGVTRSRRSTTKRAGSRWASERGQRERRVEIRAGDCRGRRGGDLRRIGRARTRRRTPRRRRVPGRLRAVVRLHGRFDPTGEYYTFSWAIQSNLMIRTLVGYDHVAGPAGNMLVPDLATAVPKPTDGGKTYTFHLKPGVKFGPPVTAPVTSNDVLYAIERIADPKDGARVRASTTRRSRASTPTRAGKAKTISGIADAEREHDRLPPHPRRPATSSTGWRCRPRGRSRPRSRGCFEGQAGKYGRTSSRPART